MSALTRSLYGISRKLFAAIDLNILVLWVLFFFWWGFLFIFWGFLFLCVCMQGKVSDCQMWEAFCMWLLFYFIFWHEGRNQGSLVNMKVTDLQVLF